MQCDVIEVPKHQETINTFNQIPVNSLYNFAWDDGPIGSRLKVQGLKNNTNYQVDWYSFKEGWYLGSDCRNTINGELVLRFPKLFVTPNEVERPMVWFVVRQQNCQVGMVPVEENLILREPFELLGAEINDNQKEVDLIVESFGKDQSIIYLNPFDNYLIVESRVDDLIQIQDINGKIIHDQLITKGNSRINTQNLSKGIYIVKLVNQGIQTKLVKQ